MKALFSWPPAAAGLRWPPAAGPALAVTLAMTFSGAAMLLTACSSVPVTTVVSGATTGGGAPASATPSGAAPSAAAPSGAARPARVFGRVFDNLGVSVTGGRLYVTWQVSPATAAVPQFELARVEQATGAIKATRLLMPGQVRPPLSADGWLWVVIATSAGESVLRLNPVDLAEAGEVMVGGGTDQGFGQGSHLAVAGGALWVADGDRLLRVSLKTGRVIATIPLPGAYTSDVGANKDGTVLIVSEATDGGLGQVQRRNPVTGTVMVSYQMIGVAAPQIGGVIESGVWIAEATGMMGYIERFGVAIMAPDPATRVEGTNGIDVTVVGGLAWVTEAGDARYDYCADPVTGHVLARIPLPDPLQGGVLAVSSRYVYYQSPASDGFYLKRLTVPAACR